MNKASKLLHFFQKLCVFNFGNFEKEEFKKFIKMGLIFALIIGIYWTLRPLKDAIFIQIVGSLQLPFAKTISVMALLPLVLFYTKLLEKISKEKMLLLLPALYGVCILGFSAAIFFVQSSVELHSLPFQNLIKILGYFWYVFVESFGSLLIALFWAFATSVTQPASAKKGFALVVAIGQLGGVILPFSIGGLPHRLGYTTDALSMICLSLLTLLLLPLIRYFLRTTPTAILTPYHGNNQEELKNEAGFLEGVMLLFKHRYLIGIFAVNFIYEIAITIFDFNFKLLASNHYSGVALSNYLSLYGSSVNLVSLLCLLLGISNITRFLGIGVALAMMPILIGIAFVGFLSFNTLSFLFILMVGSKAANYSLNGPALKQLYIPTTTDVKFKAQAWIETFGSRLSKQAGSMFNMTLAPLQNSLGATLGNARYLLWSGIFCFPLIGMWFVIALFLGKAFRKAVNKNQLIC